MKIYAINNVSTKSLNNNKFKPVNVDIVFNMRSNSAISESDILSIYNVANISFKSLKKQNVQFELNYSLDELERRTSQEAFTEFRMLEENAPEYNKLSSGDKEALVHLVKAAEALDSVYVRQENELNIPFSQYLSEQIKKGDKKAVLTKRLYDAQKNMVGRTVSGEPVYLAKGIEGTAGKGFYPADLSEKEFHEIIEKMIKDGEVEEVRKILNQRTMVFRDKDKLRAVDYTDYFKEQFTKAAVELQKAAELSSNKEFNNYLKLQAKALLYNNPEYDSEADKAWASLQYTPLEFTIGRESYDDKLTPTVSKNQKLQKLLNEHNIVPYAKDSIGVRVGIVNKEGTDYILKIKEFLPVFAEKMPFSDRYEQTISKHLDSKQSMVDADIVSVTGQFGRYTGFISIASNLPNNDKLSVQTGGGKRNVYHRQIRQAKNRDTMNKIYKAVLDESQQKYCLDSVLHDYTILHENVHSLGPKNRTENLGLNKNIIEEHKADMGAIVMLHELTKIGYYSPEKEKQIITSYIVSYLPKERDVTEAHPTRNLLQYNYFISHGAIDVSNEGKIKIDYEKIIECAQQMLENAIKLQLDGDYVSSKCYIDKYTVWTEQMEKIAKNIRPAYKKINSYVTMPLADKLLEK